MNPQNETVFEEHIAQYRLTCKVPCLSYPKIL